MPSPNIPPLLIRFVAVMAIGRLIVESPPPTWANWTPNGVRVVTYNGIFPTLAADGAGGAYLLWSEGASEFVLNHVQADGSWDSGPTPFPTPATVTAAKIAADASGGAVLGWGADQGLGGASDVFVTRLLSDLSERPDWSGGRTLSTVAGDQSGLRLVADCSGGLYASWRDERAAGSELCAAHLMAAGSGSPICTAANEQVLEYLDSDGVGGALAVTPRARNSRGARRCRAFDRASWCGRARAGGARHPRRRTQARAGCLPGAPGEGRHGHLQAVGGCALNWFRFVCYESRAFFRPRASL